MLDEGFDIEQINENYTSMRPTWANVVLIVLLYWKPSRKTLDRWLTKVRAYNEPQGSYPLLIHLARIPWLIQQGLRHLKFGEFSVITGYPGYVLWKTGVLRLMKKVFGKRMKWAPAETLG